MSTALDLVSWLCLATGGVFSVIGGVGLLRMPSFFTRMHAASLIDTLGAGLILAGLMLQAGFTLITLKLAVVGLLLLFASPTATHALAKAAIARGVDPLDKGDPPSKP
jgi:multicomponent Na+:H+ antiporter subunit G